jgi:maltooligosyltrehalose synthase
VTGAAGADQPSSSQQQQQQPTPQQQQCIAEFVTHFKVVRLYCAADSTATQALNNMSSIALGCMAATMQQQQQQQHSDRQQVLQQYVDAEVVVMAYCAHNSAAIDAITSMTSIALKALNNAC